MILKPRVRYFIDTNIFLYATGPNSEFKEQSLQILQSLEEAQAIAVSNVAVLEEVHYIYYRRNRDSEKCIQALKAIQAGLGEVFPMTEAMMLTAWQLFIRYSKQTKSVKDYYHIASMQVFGIKTIISYDDDFDSIDSIRRIDPREF